MGAGATYFVTSRNDDKKEEESKFEDIEKEEEDKKEEKKEEEEKIDDFESEKPADNSVQNEKTELSNPGNESPSQSKRRRPTDLWL